MACSGRRCALTLGAIGVVYGDIGTSPLYTIKEIFLPATGVALTNTNLIGAVSVLFWALMLVVTFKYVILILRADNRGEGGALALTALATRAVQHQPALRRALLLLGVFGATLFYGDGVITPAISVLGAMEGLEVATPALKPFVVPASVGVLLGLFLFQRFGTSAVGNARSKNSRFDADCNRSRPNGVLPFPARMRNARAKTVSTYASCTTSVPPATSGLK